MKTLVIAVLFYSTFSIAQDKILVRIEMRDRLILISDTSHGKLYTLKTRTGEILADRLDEKTLLNERPEEYAFIKSALARNQYLLLDASLGSSLRN